MRQVTQQTVQAFIDGRDKQVGHTHTTDGKLYLHGNLIARKCHGGQIQISDAGWQSNTTKERLNGLLTLLGKSYGITQKDWVWYLAGTKMESDTFYLLERTTVQAIN